MAGQIVSINDQQVTYFYCYKIIILPHKDAVSFSAYFK